LIPAKFFVSENSPWRNYFKKQKILQGPKINYFFYRDQNLNETYLQGRMQYLSQKRKEKSCVCGLLLNSMVLHGPRSILFQNDPRVNFNKLIKTI